MTDCATCGRPLKPSDGLVSRSFPEGPSPDAEDPCKAWSVEDGYWVHIACTEDGTQRWCRAGRPDSGPLAWIRRNGLNWTGLQGQAVRGRMVLDG